MKEGYFWVTNGVEGEDNGFSPTLGGTYLAVRKRGFNKNLLKVWYGVEGVDGHLDNTDLVFEGACYELSLD